jgi:hypothetical protein
MLLNAEQILATADKKTQIVPVPEWGDGAEVLVGSMGALDRARMDDWIDTIGRPKSPDPARPEAEKSPESTEPILTCDDVDPEPDADPKSPADAEGSETPPPAEKTYSSEENTSVMIRWCALCILDPKTRKRAFTDEQIEALGTKSPAVLLRIYQACLDINLATRTAAEAFEKNSEGTSGVDSGGD